MALRIATGALGASLGFACTNILVSRGASADGSTILTYNSDDMGLFGSIDLRPASNNGPNATRQIWDWDGQYYTGSIPEVTHTYNVVGNTNENGVIITETTFGGRDDLAGQGTGAIMSYGDLIFTTLTRARNAREAIAIMDYLCQTYGYESNGESFGVGDGDEVFLMVKIPNEELVGKGKYGKGAVWVASRVPDGYVTATANQARTTTFAQNDPANVLFSADIVSFARSIGAFNGTNDADFNFVAAFDPITFGGARLAEARVWNVLNEACGGCVSGHLDYAQGYNLSNPMPLFVPVKAPLTLTDVMVLMRNHGENTWFDNTGLVRPDVGAESGNSPYRARPLVWTYNNASYLNERTVGVQQSGWAFIAQSRSWLPAPIRAVEWFAPDDSSTSPRVPVFGGITRIPASFGSLVGQTPGGGVPYAPASDGFSMNLKSAFWIWNLVGNVAFSERYGVALPMVLTGVETAQAKMAAATSAMETDFVALWAVDQAAAIEFATSFAESTGEAMAAEWLAFWEFLFSTFRDGGILKPSTATQCTGGQVVNCTAKLQPIDDEVGYTDAWRGRILADSDNAKRYAVPSGFEADPLEQAKLKVLKGKRRTL